MKPERRLVATPLTLEVVRDSGQLRPLKAEWTRFAAKVQGVTPFQLPEWQLTWWRHFGSGQLHVMIFRSVDSIVGIIPCFLDDSPGCRTMRLAGAGISGYLEPPILPARRDEVLSLLRGHLLAKGDWQICEWRDLAASSALSKLSLGESAEWRLEPDVECSEVPIQGTFQQFWEARSFSLRRNFLRYLDNAAVADRPRLEVVSQADPEFVNALIRLQTEDWERRQEPGVKPANGTGAFLYDLARELDDGDLLRFFGLRFNRKIVAVTMAFVYRNTLYAFSGGHDKEFEAQGFGRLLLFESLRHAFEQGYCGWNFLRGNEAYKQLWGAQVIPKSRLTFARKT